MDVPSMVQRSGDQLIVRRVVSGEQVILSHTAGIKAEATEEEESERQERCYRRSSLIDDEDDNEYDDDDDEDERLSRAEQVLPQCKVKRNYSCGHCRYFTQNPRQYLTHLRDTHGEKIVINGCPRCLYASRHHQKLVRHMKMVHGAAGPTSEPWPHSDARTVVKQELTRPHRRQPHADSPKHPRKGSTPSARNTQQQLVASGLSDLLLEIQQSWNRTITDTNFGLGQKTLKLEMDGLPSLVTPSDEVAPGGDRSSPRKRHRPIPNLIPLAGGRPAKEPSLKPVPMSALMPPQEAPATKCTFCELVYESTVELANHIAAAHKEDLITSLLQKSIDDSSQAGGPVVLLPNAEHDSTSSSSDVWKTLLESSLGAPTGAPDDRKQTADGNDDEVEILENKSETYCGIETAPGYGEVTNTITGPSAGLAGPPVGGVMKKVFKCPHCSFWASTASRFHVHIVGHLNKKPFECSLCAYRSNWRWDITKHIRLKTIRDPSHKNAGVLMNDETGRRNYTKYNKYITLMQITDHNAKDAAVVGAGGAVGAGGVYSKSLVGGAVTDLMTACRTYNIDLQTITSLPGFKLLLQQQQQQDEKHPEDSAAREDAKCPVCDHSASSKEDLVLHMTNVHITLPAGIPTISLDETTTESETVAAPDPGPTGESQNCTPSTSFCSQATNPCVDRSPTNGALVGDGATSDKPIGLLELGDGGDSSGGGGGGGAGGGTQKVAMPTWRHNAPYRCGHCQQVSNWKHVIQRHCRLKHNGNVFIELTTNSADEPTTTTTTVVVDGDGGGHYLRGTKPTNHSFYVVEEQPASEATEPPLAPFGSIHDELASSTLEPIVEINDKDATDLIGLDRMLGPPSDPTADSPLNVDSLQHLTDHLELQLASNGRDNAGGQDNIEILAQGTVPTCLYYCPRCPARFFGEAPATEHLERHGTGAGAKPCTICSFGAPTEDELARHAEVHTAQYNKSTENLQVFLDEHAIYRRPTLTLRVRSGGEQVWSVKATPQPSEVTVQPPSGGRKSKRLRSDGEQPISRPQVRSIFLCEYCDSAFDGESELNGHVRGHFAAILAPAEVAYYTSLNNASLLSKDNQFELIVSGTQQQQHLAAAPMPLRYVYDNGRRKEWSSFSKAESVLLKL
ncbi:uncharacterized protein LOC131207308 [Anopheles bellator]|uniref:uncharacterized protein LOC131207308 n=1 Tax=Anopheles bellator TaxID=139047 RepID=UPI0026491A56|nr:uncharacterized protein LOC131207308 [Anopheles bellator]